MATNPTDSTKRRRLRGKLKEEHETIIQQNWTYLMEELDAKHILDYMYQERTFDCDDYEEIRQKTTRADRTNTLMTKLMRAGPRAYDVFVEALKRAGYKEAVAKINHGTGRHSITNMERTALLQLRKIDHINTKAYKQAEEKLNNFGIVIVIGNPGSGKTNIGHHLMERSKDHENRRPLFLTNHSQLEDIPIPEDLENIKEEDKFVIMIDDIFGLNYLVTDFKDSWDQKFRTLWSHIETGMIKLIVTFKSHIFYECENSLTKFDVFMKKHQLDLSNPETSLTIDEKRNILKIILDVKGIVMTADDKETVLRQPFDELGFPQCCMFYVESSTAREQGVEYFKNPTEYIKQQVLDIMKGNPLQYFVLLAVVFKHGRLHVDSLDPFTEDTVIQKILSVCNIAQNLPGKMKDAANSLCGLYLKYNDEDEEYSFIHDQVFDVVFLYFSSHCLKQSIKICSVPMLIKYVITSDKDVKSADKVTVNKNYFSLLAEIFTQLIPSMNAKILEHRSFKNETFMEYLIKEHWQSTIPTEIVSYTFRHQMYEMQFQITKYKLIEYWGDVKETASNISVDKYFSREHIAFECSSPASVALWNDLNTLSNCFLSSNNEHQKNELLKISCLMGSTEVANVLLKDGISPTIEIFVAAAVSQTDNLEVFRTLLNYKENINMNDDDLGSLLYLALEQGNVNISSFLIDQIGEMEHNKPILDVAVKHLHLLLLNTNRSWSSTKCIAKAVKLFKQLTSYNVEYNFEDAILLTDNLKTEN